MPIQVAYGHRGELHLRPVGNVDIGRDGVLVEVGDDVRKVVDGH